MDFRRLFAITRRWFPLLAASAVLAGAAAYAASGLVTKTWEAKTTLIVGQSLSSANPDYNELLVSERLSATYAELVMTRPVLVTVIQQLGLNETPEDLAQRANATAATDSTLLTITAQSSDAGRAAEIANAMASELIAISPTIQGSQTDLQKSIQADLLATQDQIDSTQAEVDRLSGLASPAPADLTQLDTLQSRLATLRSTYTTLLTFSSNSGSNLLSIVEPAVPPIVPISPRPLLNALIAAALGLLLSFGLAWLLESLDESIKDPQAVEQLTGLTTLAAIPSIKADRSETEVRWLVTVLDPHAPAAEAYRTLRNNVEFASMDEPLRTLLVTSAGPNEGKSVTAANLAVTMAQSGRRVLLVDTDLRKAGVHEIFNLPNVSGLTTLLRSAGHTYEQITHKTAVDGLRVLTTGPLPASPVELFGSRRMHLVMEQLKANADLLILDGPPLQSLVDASSLTQHADGTIMVIDARRSRRRVVAAAQESLTFAGARVLGAVLNRVPSHAWSPIRRLRDTRASAQEGTSPASGPGRSSTGTAR